MRRRYRLLHPIALLLALGSLAACGEDGPTPVSDPDPVAETPSPESSAGDPHPIRWVRGLSAGREAAGDPDALLFVYVARHKPT